MARLLPTRAGALIGFYVLELNLAFWTYHGTKKQLPLRNHYLTQSQADRREQQLRLVLQSLQAFTESIQLIPEGLVVATPGIIFSWQARTLTHFLQLVEPFYGSSIYSGGPPDYDLLVPVLFDHQFHQPAAGEFRLLLGLGLIEKCAQWMMALQLAPDGPKKVHQVQQAIERFHLAPELPDDILQILIDQGDLDLTPAKQVERQSARRPKYFQPEPQHFYRQMFNTIHHYSNRPVEAQTFLADQLKSLGRVSVKNFYRYLTTPQLLLTYPLARQVLDQVDYSTLEELSEATRKELPVQWAKALSLVWPLEASLAGVFLEFLSRCVVGLKLKLHRMMSHLIRQKSFGTIQCHGEFHIMSSVSKEQHRLVYAGPVILALYRLLFQSASVELQHSSFYRLLTELSRRPDYEEIRPDLADLLRGGLDQGLIRPTRWLKHHLSL